MIKLFIQSRTYKLLVISSIAFCLVTSNLVLAITSAINANTELIATIDKTSQLLQLNDNQEEDFCNKIGSHKALVIIPELKEGGLLWTSTSGTGILLWRDHDRWATKKILSYKSNSIGLSIVGIPVFSWFGVWDEERQVILAAGCDPTIGKGINSCIGKKALSPVSGVNIVGYSANLNPGEIAQSDDKFAMNNGVDGIRLSLLQASITPEYDTIFDLEKQSINKESDGFMSNKINELNTVANTICNDNDFDN